MKKVDGTYRKRSFSTEGDLVYGKSIAKKERQKRDSHAQYWCRRLVTACYGAILASAATLVAVWYLFALPDSSVDQQGYWLRFILLPTLGMLVVNAFADYLIRSDRLSLLRKEYVALYVLLFFCTYVCFVHSIVAVLLASFIVPVLISTIFANRKMTRRVFFSALLLLVLSSLKMQAFSTREFGVWIWVESLTAFGLLVASYFLAKVLIIYGQDNLSDLHSVCHDKESLEEQLKRDPLTGLYNRKAYGEFFPRVMQECRSAGQPLAVAELDVDNFKQVNDKYGHTTGDRVLLRLSDILKTVVSENISAYRMGGEEFVLLFPNYTQEDAVKECEWILSLLRSSPLPEMDYQKITFSCGVAQMEETHYNPESLFQAADQALYAAKNSGKNKVVRYSAGA